MNNKTMKILIVLGIFVALAFGAKNIFADYPVYRSNGEIAYVVKTPDSDYSDNSNDNYQNQAATRYYRTSQNTSSSSSPSSKTGTTIVYNYYTTTQPVPKVATTTKTSNSYISTTKNNTTNTDTSTTKSNSSNANTDNNATDSTTNKDGVYGGATNVTGNGLTALSLRGSGSFMPSSIWQWILVVFLILIVIILVRIVSKQPRPKIQEVHA